MSEYLDDNKYAKTINNWQVSCPVTASIPSLSVVSWQYSVLPALLNTNILKSYFIASNPLSSVKPLNDTVVSTATGSFIAVGVNRWASVYVINTSAYTETNDIPNYVYFNSAKQLQDIAGQYFYDYVSVKDDLITMKEDVFKRLATSKLDVNPSTMPTIMMSALNYTELGVQETAFEVRKAICADYLWNNVFRLQQYIKNNVVLWNTTAFTVNSALSADPIDFRAITS